MKFSRQCSLAAFIFIFCLLHFTTANAKVKVGQVFPDFKLTQLGQAPKTVALSSLKGKVVVLDFWASWCEPCKVELPVLNKLYKKYHASGLEIVGVNEDKEMNEAKTFLKAYPMQIPLLEDGAKGEVLSKLDVDGLPVTYVLDKTGKVTHIHKGFKEGDLEKFEKEIAILIKSK
jgi:thiol-disulfide isomerase/thioredoxin